MMSWWKINREAKGEDALYLGDEPLDAVGIAISMIESQYAREWRRPPQPEEMQKCLDLAYRCWLRAREAKGATPSDLVSLSQKN
jgi:hypothetical protein